MFPGYRGRTYHNTSVNTKAEKELNFFRYSTNWVVFSWFAGFTLIVLSAFQTFITIDTIFHIFLIVGAVATGIHYYLTENRKLHMIPAMAFYNFMGVGALVCGLALMANLTFTGPTQHEIVKIAKIDKTQSYTGNIGSEDVMLKNSDIKHFKYIIKFDQWKWNEFENARAVKITYKPGLFGFRVYKGASLIKE